jgi:large subunit ribosomal protein L44e
LTPELVGFGIAFLTINMKLPKEKNRYCPYCRKHTSQLVLTAKQKSRSSAHPLSRDSPSRVKKRSLHGYGNWGKRSKKGAKDWKMKVKVTKKINIMYKCKVCNKIKPIRKGIRSSRIVIGEKVSK